MQRIGEDIYKWCCALCPQVKAYNEQRQAKKPQLRHGRCCARAPLTHGNHFPAADNKHLGNLDDSFRVGTDQANWYKEPGQNTDETVPSSSNLDSTVIDLDARSSTPSSNSPEPLLPPGNFDGTDTFAKIEQDAVDWPESDASSTAGWQ
jgi:hypothetical protein